MTVDLPTGHEWQPKHLRLAVTAAGVALWAWNVDTDLLTMDARGFELWGMPWSDKVTLSNCRPTSTLPIVTVSVRRLQQRGPYSATMRLTFAS